MINPATIGLGFLSGMMSGFASGGTGVYRIFSLPPRTFASSLPPMEDRIPQISGTSRRLQSSLAYGFSGPRNSTSDGLAIPVLGGRFRTGAQVINYYIEAADKREILYLLLAIAEGPLEAVVYGNTVSNIWVSKNRKLSEIKGAEFQTRAGTHDQTAIDWFGELHQVRTVEIDLTQPTKLLLHFEESPFRDSSIFSRTITANGVTRSSAQRKFGTYSGLFASSDVSDSYYLDLTDGSADENGAFDLGSDDFTFEVWLRPGTLTAFKKYGIWKWQNETDRSGYGLEYYHINESLSQFLFRSEGTSGGVKYFVFAYGHMTSDNWYHIALVRSGNRFYFFFNGTDEALPSVDDHWEDPLDRPSNPGVVPTLGKAVKFEGGTYDWRGYMDEMRLVRGQAIYTSDFTPPDAPFEGYETDLISTRGTAVDKLSLIFAFPYGLYAEQADQSTGEITVVGKDVEIDVLVSRDDWSGTYYQWLGDVRRISAFRKGMYRAQITLEFNLMTYTTVSGTFQAGEQITGSTSGAKATIAVRRSSTAMYVVNVNGTFQAGEQITGSTSGATGTVSTVPAPDAKRWHVKVYRRTDDDYRSSSVSACSLYLVDEIYRKSLAYPNVALLGLKVPYTDKAADLEDVSVIADQGDVTIPQWAIAGGGTQTRPSSNPAYMLVRVLCNCLGVDIERIDRDSILAWADYCSAAVGSVARASWNGIFDTLGTGDDAVNAILKVGRASLVKSDKYRVKVETVVQESQFTGLFTAGNIVSGSYDFQWIRKSDHPHAVTVEYYDAAAEYERRSVSYRGPEYDLTDEPLRIERDFLIGCTSQDQARRYAILRWQLANMPNCTCQFETSVQGINCEPGDVIWVQPMHSRRTFGGLVVSGTTTSVTLDQPVRLDSSVIGGLATIWVRHANGSIERRTISGPFDTETSTLSVSSAWSSTPARHDLYGIGRFHSNVNAIDVWRWRVLEMTVRGAGERVRLSCIEYNPNVYYHKDYGGGATII